MLLAKHLARGSLPLPLSLSGYVCLLIILQPTSDQPLFSPPLPLPLPLLCCHALFISASWTPNMPLAAIHRLTWPQDMGVQTQRGCGIQWGRGQSKQLRSCCLHDALYVCVCGIFDINSFGQFYKRLSGLTCSSGIHIFH